MFKLISLFLIYIGLTTATLAQQSPSSGRLDILRDPGEEGFLKALNIKQFNFPEDHAAHTGYRHEWWYLTGNLEDPKGRRFGYELTFFRLALSPEKDGEINETSSAWKTSQIFAAHFAVTDVENEVFHFSDRYSRADGRLAGVKKEPVRVWLDDWTLEQTSTGWKLSANDGDVKLELELSPIKAMVLHGEQGLSRKSAEPGNATYYYSLPRMDSKGVLEIEGQSFAVNGLTWFDREWGTSALGTEQQGWDWYALHLSDGSDLMFYNLRNKDGSRHAFSGGSWIDVEGNRTAIKAEDIIIEVTDYWQSPLGGRYPSGWKLNWPEKQLEITIEPVIKNQELNTLPRYWEGAVDVVGQLAGKTLSGRGYVELTGYTN